MIALDMNGLEHFQTSRVLVAGGRQGHIHHPERTTIPTGLDRFSL